MLLIKLITTKTIVLSIALLVCLLRYGVNASSSYLTTLTEDDFEHLTQAATGQKTGKWFVNFQSDRCFHCNNLAPTWLDLAEETATEHKDLGILIAKGNTPENPKLSRQFGINAYPTNKYFADRKMYDYSGPRDVDAFVNFITKEYKNAKGETVPSAPGAFEEALKKLRKAVKDNKHMVNLLNNFEHILKMRKNAAVFLLVLGAVLGFIVTTLIGLMMGSSSGSSDSSSSKSKKK